MDAIENQDRLTLATVIDTRRTEELYALVVAGITQRACVELADHVHLRVDGVAGCAQIRFISSDGAGPWLDLERGASIWSETKRSGLFLRTLSAGPCVVLAHVVAEE
jgi:hypothetical protein